MADEETKPTGKDNTPLDSNDDKGQPDPLKKLSNELFTRIGRLDAEHKKDQAAILETLREMRQGRETTTTETTTTQQKNMNEKWAERILNGDVAGVLDEALSLREQAQKTLSQRVQNQVEKMIAGLAETETPYFKEVKDAVKETALKLVGQGYSPQDAVSFGYEKARADHLHNIVTGGGGSGTPLNLETLGGGSRREDAGEKKGKLPPALKAAYERDKKYFKDEADYINHMSPQVRKQYGL